MWSTVSWLWSGVAQSTWQLGSKLYDSATNKQRTAQADRKRKRDEPMLEMEQAEETRAEEQKRKAEEEERKLVASMFHHVRNPTQLRMWREHTRPQLAALLTDALLGIDGVVQLALEWCEPSGEEASMGWEPRLQPVTSYKRKKRIDVRCSRLGGLPYLRHDEGWPTIQRSASTEQDSEKEVHDIGSEDAKEAEEAEEDSQDEHESDTGASHFRPQFEHDEEGSSGSGWSEARKEEFRRMDPDVHQRHSFVMQLRLSELPADIARAYSLPDRPLDSQLLQVFGGGSCASHDNPHSGTAVCRLVDCSAPAKRNVVPPPGNSVYSTQLISGWHQPHRVYPSTCHVLPDELTVPPQLSDRRKELFGEGGKYFPDSFASQLSGWPHDDGQYQPSMCDVCGQAMELVMQVNSQTVGYEVFGCSAPLAVSQCGSHKQQIKMSCTIDID